MGIFYQKSPGLALGNNPGNVSCNACVSRHRTAYRQQRLRDRQEVRATVPAEDGKCDCIGPRVFLTARQLQLRMALLCFIHQSLHNYPRSGLGCHFAFRRSSRNCPLTSIDSFLKPFMASDRRRTLLRPIGWFGEKRNYTDAQN